MRAHVTPLTRFCLCSGIACVVSLLFITCSEDTTLLDPGSDRLRATVTDIDGNVYQTVKIGDQWWMAENLRVARYRNKDPIPIVTDSVCWACLSTGACCIYGNETSPEPSYGRLYNWYAVKCPRGLAPEGWHVPTDEEWKSLEMYLGMSQSMADTEYYRGTNQGGMLKGTGNSLWKVPNAGATNEYGFSALPGGGRSAVTIQGIGKFVYRGEIATFWSSTQKNAHNAWFRILSYERADIYRLSSDKQLGFAVRCVKD